MGTEAFPVPWAGATATVSVATKVGSLQPSPVFSPRPKTTVAPCATAVLPTTSVHRGGERNGEPAGEPHRSCAVHPVSDSFVDG